MLKHKSRAGSLMSEQRENLSSNSWEFLRAVIVEIIDSNVGGGVIFSIEARGATVQVFAAGSLGEQLLTLILPGVVGDFKGVFPADDADITALIAEKITI